MTQIKLRDYQQKAVDEIEESFSRNKAVLFVLATAGGKCLGVDTPILMHDGTIKKVQDVAVGDRLMGPDSKPRNVLSLARGREELYRVIPKKGDSYVVNKSHILSLRMTGNKSRVKCGDGNSYGASDIANVNIDDYLSSSKTFKHCAKGWRSSVEFERKEYSEYLPPYFLGLWLGDGSARGVSITTADIEIENYIRDFAEQTKQRFVVVDEKSGCNTFGVRGSGTGGCKGNPSAFTLNEMHRHNLIRNKHIPLTYLTGSRDQRMQLLAGLLDSDGYNSGKGVDVVFKSEKLMDGLIYLCRSLGFSAYKTPCKKTCTNTGAVGDYFRTFICGDLDQIPTIIPRNKCPERRQKKNVLNVGISVEPIGVGDYYGFEIDGDHLFMLGDFTVTHNTFTFSYIAREHGKRNESVMIGAHRQELISQASLSLASIGVRHQIIAPNPLINKIKSIHFSKLGESFVDPFSHVYVGSVQTIIRRLDKVKRPDLLIVDEAHRSTSNTWLKVIDHFDTKVLGVTATPIRSDGVGLGRVYNDMVIGKSMKELIIDGNLSPYRVYSTPEDINLDEVKRIQSGDSKGDYNTRDLEKQMDKPKIVGRAVEHYEKYAKGKPALVFAVSVSHSEHIAEEFCKAGYKFKAVSAKTEDAERFRVVDDLKNGRIDGVVNCDLFGEGTDIPGVEVVIMMRPISDLAFSLFSQQVGRALRLSEGKEYAIVLDMVGNFQRHGFPEDKTDWTLDDREKKKKGSKSDEDTTKVKTCHECFFTHKFAPECPECGYVYPVASAREYEQVDGDLVEIERKQEIERRRLEQNQLLRDAKTASQMAAIDAKLGMKRGATAYKAKYIQEKKKAMVNLRKAVKHYKENVAWGNPVAFDAILQRAFGYTEKEVMKLSADKANELIGEMRELLELRNQEADPVYSHINYPLYLDALTRGESLEF